ncbi:MAG: hypothetical protein FJZ75_09290 [Bacteroidetes bacterium]|nr:hypothetical protein [Bacteroidota bacterium]
MHECLRMYGYQPSRRQPTQTNLDAEKLARNARMFAQVWIRFPPCF